MLVAVLPATALQTLVVFQIMVRVVVGVASTGRRLEEVLANPQTPVLPVVIAVILVAAATANA